jgi:hypothetical protein
MVFVRDGIPVEQDPGALAQMWSVPLAFYLVPAGIVVVSWLRRGAPGLSAIQRHFHPMTGYSKTRASALPTTQSFRDRQRTPEDWEPSLNNWEPSRRERQKP